MYGCRSVEDMVKNLYEHEKWKYGICAVNNQQI